MYKNFEHLLQLHGINAATFSKDTKISQSTISTWKSSGNIGPKYLKTIADYFDCSIDLIVTGEEREKGKTYYLNEKTAKMAQEMFEDEDMRSLFSMKRKMTPERFSMHVKHMKEIFEQETDAD